ncbi:MAG TPA: nucleotidyltransferase, partial [Candidatus Ozemobacteraceae bacterium]|nr:nucleotidyltransferase [Candidatus Ozemobacteraceae bacterium]
ANCQIEDGADLQNVILGDGCVVKAGARLSDSVLWDRVFVGRKVVIDEALIASGTQIRENADIEKGVVISEECRIGEGAVVRQNVKIWPRKQVEDGSTVYTSLVWSEKWTKNLFSNHVITGLANLEITPELASKVGAAFGGTLPKGSSVTTSRDAHRASRMINRAFITGLISSGVQVADLQVTPAPVARYKLSAFGRAGGVHVACSSSDTNQIEIKIFDSEGRDLATGQQKNIERLFNREDFRRVPMMEVGEISFPARVAERYRDELLGRLDLETIRKKHFKVVVDYAFSGASSIFQQVLGKLNCEVIALNSYQQEVPATRSAQETVTALANVAQIVKSLGADLGLMLDPNAEHLYFVDDRGHPIYGEKSLMAWVSLVFATNPGTRVCVPVSTTHVVEQIAAKAHGTIIRTKTSSRALMAAATGDKVTFCGDGFGATIFPDFQPAFDAMMSAAKLIEFLARSEKPLSKIVEDLPRFYSETRQIPCPWEAKGAVMRQAMEYAHNHETILIDGVKVVLAKDEWVMILPDPDKPFVNLTVEAGSDNRCRELLEDVQARINTWKGNGGEE